MPIHPFDRKHLFYFHFVEMQMCSTLSGHQPSIIWCIPLWWMNFFGWIQVDRDDFGRFRCLTKHRQRQTTTRITTNKLIKQALTLQFGQPVSQAVRLVLEHGTLYITHHGICHLISKREWVRISRCLRVCIHLFIRTRRFTLANKINYFESRGIRLIEIQRRNVLQTYRCTHTHTHTGWYFIQNVWWNWHQFM